MLGRVPQTFPNKKCSWWWETCATRVTRREEKYRQLVRCRTTLSYAEGVLTYQQAKVSYSVFRLKISKSTQATIIHWNTHDCCVMRVLW